MIFKTVAVHDGWAKMNPNLQAVALAIDGYLHYHFALELIITSIIRQNSATHSRGDAFDFRANMTKPQGDEMYKFITERFDYGNGYKTLVDERIKPPGSKAWTAPHFHAQGNWRNRARGWR